MNTWRMTGSTSFVRSDSPLLSVGTSRQPSRIWPFARDRALDLLLAGHPRRGLLRQEHHADAVLADRRQREALRARRRGAGTRRAAGSGCRRRRPAADRRRSRRDASGSRGSSSPCVMIAWRLLALDVGDEAEAAGVVLVAPGRTGPGAPEASAIDPRNLSVHGDLAVVIGVAADRRSIAGRHGFRESRAKPVYTSRDAAMRQGSGIARSDGTATQQFPPGGRFDRGKSTCAGPVLRL